MKRAVLAAVLALATVGCGSPTGPSTTTYICATQPRGYALPDGTLSVEIDHYVSATPCPVVPIP